ncbi:peptidoglycan DD-metalloendopeptidase family protein [Pseudoxanthomonas sp.]|uniref:M23 family metallopeptidase n=1 Tax=Pseudoxanthomonas sp. TaxID=1871049 RepID=UPI0025FFACC5|nr:peptidoglycan DD-metalloendopeptidase family protein [Pseudoxanthomonas sp.]
MKYVLGLLLVVALGVVVWSGMDIVPTPASDPSQPVASAGVSTSAATAPPGAANTPVVSVAGTVAPASVAPVPGVSSDMPAPSALLLPVQGIRAADLTDTFTDARSEGRSHDAIDIMAAKGTPVLAVADGHVEKLFTSERGGLTIYQFEPTGRYAYYYAHLDRYADGLAEKQQIRRGQVIGYVGATGNASPAAPHLHFAIFLLGPEKQWWKGSPVNPYPILTAQQAL